MDKIKPCLWFDNQAEVAMNFYTSVFKNAKVLGVSRYGEGVMGEPGSVMTVSFEIEGQEFMGINGGPYFEFTPAVSFFVTCESQAEVDELWEKLTAEGEPSQCGWLKDKFGVSWQIVPAGLNDYISGPDPVKAQRATQAMLQMSKLDLGVIKEAYDKS